MPTLSQLNTFEDEIKIQSISNENLKKIADSIPSSAHPMSEIASLVGLMSAFHSTEEDGDDEKNMMRLMATLPIMATWNYKKA